jgi:DNA gyrase/topoisomerase IV subunit B
MSDFTKLNPLGKLKNNVSIYIGKTMSESCSELIIENDDGVDKIVEKDMTFFPASLKLFDEILVNATDTIFPFSTKRIDVEINKYNDGMLRVVNYCDHNIKLTVDKSREPTTKNKDIDSAKNKDTSSTKNKDTSSTKNKDTDVPIPLGIFVDLHTSSNFRSKNNTMENMEQYMDDYKINMPFEYIHKNTTFEKEDEIDYNELNLDIDYRSGSNGIGSKLVFYLSQKTIIEIVRNGKYFCIISENPNRLTLRDFIKNGESPLKLVFLDLKKSSADDLKFIYSEDLRNKNAKNCVSYSYLLSDAFFDLEKSSDKDPLKSLSEKELRKIANQNTKELYRRRVYDSAICYAHKGVTFNLNYDGIDKKLQFRSYEDGIKSLLGNIVFTSTTPTTGNDSSFSVVSAPEFSSTTKIKKDMNNSVKFYGFINGTHFKKGVTKELLDYIIKYATAGKAKNCELNSSATIAKNNIYFSNYILVCNLFIHAPMFKDQNKTELTNNDLFVKRLSVIDESSIKDNVTRNKKETAKLINDMIEKDRINKRLLFGNIDQRIIDKHSFFLNLANKKITVNNELSYDIIKKYEKPASIDKTKNILVITEGNSAKTAITKGFSTNSDNIFYAFFPLRGKPKNTYNTSDEVSIDNEEFKCILKIVNLNPNLKYETQEELNTLKFIRIIFGCDQDSDGFHIISLLMCFVWKYFKNLFLKGYFRIFFTPIITYKLIKSKHMFTFNESIFKQYKISHSEKYIKFYDKITFKKFEEYLDDNNLRNTMKLSYKMTYLKGLGSSDEEQSQEFVNDMYLLTLIPKGDFKEEILNNTEEWFKLAFDKSKSDARKEFLNINTTRSILPDDGKYELELFMQNEFKNYSNEANIRSIPLLSDGLKESLRKIMYTVVSKMNTSEKYASVKTVKVNNMASIVSDKTKHKHGEVSLNDAIVLLAQNFIDSNNLPMLHGVGLFGSRKETGDAAQPRYIEVKESECLKYIFNKKDFKLVNYVIEDGEQLEPLFLLPNIPITLINGTAGIGTGYSTYIPRFHPIDIIDIISNRLKIMINFNNNFDSMDMINELNRNYDDMRMLTPWSKLSLVDIQRSKTGTSFSQTVRYRYDKDTNNLYVLDIPLGIKLNNITELLLLDAPSSDFKIKKTTTATDTTNNKTIDSTSSDYVYINDYTVITFGNYYLFKLKLKHSVDEEDIAKILKRYKFSNSKALSISNTTMRVIEYETNDEEPDYSRIHYKINNSLSNEEHNVKIKNMTIRTIITEWITYRSHFYLERKKMIIYENNKQLLLLKNKIRYIKDTNNGTINHKNINSVSKLIDKLVELKYDDINEKDEDGDDDEDNGTKSKTRKFGYLIKLPMISLVEEEINKLEKQHDELNKENKKFIKKNHLSIWLEELDGLKTYLLNYEENVTDVDAYYNSVLANKKNNEKSMKKLKVFNKVEHDKYVTRVLEYNFALPSINKFIKHIGGKSK